MAGTAVDFEPAARQVGHRLTVRQALRWANRSVGWAVLGAVISVLILRQAFAGSAAWWAAPAVLLGWAVVCAGLAWRRRPDAYGALAYWDSVSRTAGSLASAWWFGQRPEPAMGERLHLRESAEVLQRRLPDLKAEVPMGEIARSWGWLLLVPVILASGVGRRSLAWEDRPVTERMKEAAAALAEDLAVVRENLRHDQVESPEGTAPEAQVAELLAGAEGLLANPGGATTGELLNALEDRARLAETMAREFAGPDEWVPAEVLRELERHADTAGLAQEIREKRPAGGATESARLAELANSPAAPRLQRALESALAKGNEGTPESPVLHHLDSAESHLSSGQTAQAADDFGAMGEHFRGLARKQQAREEMEALASQLRAGAEELAGASQDGPGEAGPPQTPPPGAELLTAQAPPAPTEGNASTPPPVTPGDSKAPAPVGNAAPIPGSPGAPVPGEASAPVPVPGTVAPPPVAALPLQAPVPGQAPASSSFSLSAPVPGQSSPGAPGTTSGLQPGLNAGEGTAALVPSPSKVLASVRDDKVQTATGTEGASEMRTVESKQGRQENVTRDAQGTSGDFFSVEEGAMDEAALPTGRRDQVRRYFNALRESFDSAEEP